MEEEYVQEDIDGKCNWLLIVHVVKPTVIEADGGSDQRSVPVSWDSGQANNYL
jgi:hypothetical protein